MNNRNANRNTIFKPGWMIALLWAMILAGCSTMNSGQTSRTESGKMEQQWGVRPVAIRLVAGGHFIDFRYQVIDPDKALVLLNRNHTPYLIDEATGKVHTVPVTKLGPMRASAVKAKANRNYLVLFGNGEKRIHRGSLVTVVIGDFRAEHLEIM